MWLSALWLPVGIVITGLAIAQFASLQHEIIHGHPFKTKALNQALVFPALPLFIPFLRFRDTHLAHHQDSILTDPYDDPESNYMDGGEWARLPSWMQTLLLFNNRLLGRLTVGPVISQLSFMRADWVAIRNKDLKVLMGWVWHIPAMGIVIIWLIYAPMPVWAYLVATYLGLSILKIRTFLEHQAHEKARGRTVIIEDHGPLAFLFLNNNLHVVHHMHPKLPWYRLPAVYRANVDRYLKRNEGYYFASYAQVFRDYFWKAKDPVPHPIWRRNP
ncbi:fatty acid desaturase [Sulfitobacter sp. 1151]|uniref:Fatty acid desaturase n=2 Tax=Parasulfitobacter algicola TaxID=2614809 RepID=A0ABX2IU75_9RHOB|nr:fatty acid desaturase [Sulfitobacter algicola]